MSARVLLIDNYDSFVFNLARYFQELGVATDVRRNDETTLEDIRRMSPAAICLSPGPCTPAEAGICLELVQELGSSIPILGVCLGHQVIGAACGAAVIRAREPVHGRTSLIQHSQSGLFENCVNPLHVARYHSLIVEAPTLPDCFSISASTLDGTIMALTHRTWPLYGVQFHPESVLTQQGHQLLVNFLALAGVPVRHSASLGDLPDEQEHEDDFFRRAIAPAVFRPM